MNSSYQNNQLQSNKNIASTQSFLPFKEIRDGIIILKNDTLRAVLMVKASGFDLKSTNEQEAIIASFEGFINSLTFPIQILMRSKKVDLAPYLKSLKNRQELEENDLVAVQMEDYIEFIKELTTSYNIMSKTFYVVIPHNPGGFQKVSFWKGLFGEQKNNTLPNFEKEKIVLLERIDIVMNELQGVGLRATQLNTEELIELFYGIYNPEALEGEKINNLTDLTTPIITKQPKESKSSNIN